MFNAKKFLISLIVCLITGCSTTTSYQQPSLSWAQRQAQVLKLTRWSIDGAVGIRNPENSWSASFNWHQAPTDYHLQLFAPLGAGSLSLKGDQSLVQLITSKGEHYEAPTTQELLSEQTGWFLPVELLQYWIRGIPAPKLPAQLNFDTRHRLQKLAQQGWVIEYSSYNSVNNLELPSTLVLQSEDLKVRIHIKHWRL